MKQFNLKEHNMKMFALSKNAAKGIYPSKKIARAGSFFGTGIGIVFFLMGIFLNVLGYVWGFGILLAGIITVVSNIFNLKRTGKNSKS
ncbi:hypothetical protein acsn021_17820 [Anaerocolumna cellulosilytica]|uniref:Uncharacterized protein n=1 Tax=Anaerocolumna cellulosilytica TaxID=433286 RepID=A0A6S6QSA0_9FIRM|nr:hypothetical protein [Anaerocolumna cellulosilytica]MBB5194823.1 hypothetical protein [Anaerocolumna cellulosilytica]BCJ94213.1 hypothetical protein acsn021_17820 [Anaerocolumna cellulosilytica]